MSKAFLPANQKYRDEAEDHPAEAELAKDIDFKQSQVVGWLKQHSKELFDLANRIEDRGIDATVDTHMYDNSRSNQDFITTLNDIDVLKQALGLVRAERAGARNSINRVGAPPHMPVLNLTLTGKERDLLDYFYPVGRVVRFERKQGRGTIAGVDISLEDGIALRDSLSQSSVLSMAGNQRPDMLTLIEKLNAAI